MTIFTLNVFFTNPEEMLMKIHELSADIAALSEQLTKAQTEILNKIADLEVALDDADVPEEAADALAALRFTVQALDEIVPDADPEQP